MKNVPGRVAGDPSRLHLRVYFITAIFRLAESLPSAIML